MVDQSWINKISIYMISICLFQLLIWEGCISVFLDKFKKAYYDLFSINANLNLWMQKHLLLDIWVTWGTIW